MSKLITYTSKSLTSWACMQYVILTLNPEVYICEPLKVAEITLFFQQQKQLRHILGTKKSPKPTIIPLATIIRPLLILIFCVSMFGKICHSHS